MSGFDGMFRSQQFAADQRWKGTMAESAGLTGGADALVKGAIDGRQLAMREAESQAAVRMHESNRALNQQKLLEMQAVDQTEMSRLGIEGQREQVLAARLAREDAEYQIKRRRERDSKFGAGDEALGETLKRWGDFAKNPAAVMAAGLVMKDGKIRPGTPAEIEEYRREVDADALRGSSSTHQLNRDRVGRELARVRDQMFTSPGSRAQLEPVLRSLEREYASYFQNGDMPKADAPQATPQASSGSGTAQKAPPPPDMQRRNFIASNVFQDPVWESSPALSVFAVDHETRAAMSRGLGALADMMLTHRTEQGRQMDPAQAHKIALAAAEKSPQLLGFAMKMGGFSDDEIRVRLRSTFPSIKTKERMDSIMRYVDEDTKRLSK